MMNEADSNNLSCACGILLAILFVLLWIAWSLHDGTFRVQVVPPPGTEAVQP